ncbi:hypothetical protein [Actinomadura mexicana]|uniref:Uncharacterized protein n=1 Tax=Actinomadura mexicana TaxID=134959 RepID=A0A238VX94_9ACTN|nr:hypothetical protein [Actinomadura mexicana]SNR38858.1 hypothetical protein SAMN06265355_102488 [Actinomadura mexicana]
MKRRVVDIAASGAACSAMTAALMFFSVFQGQGEVASRASDTKVAADAGVPVQKAPSSHPEGAKKRCVLRSWRPAVSGKGAAAKVVGYGSIICDKPGHITLEVSLCKRVPLGGWACNTGQNSYVLKKWGAYLQVKATIPCERTPGRETYRTAVVGDVVQGWGQHHKNGDKARLFCPG